MEAEKIFPQSQPQNPLYMERYAWIRYMFFVVTTGLFAVIFWLYLGFALVSGDVQQKDFIVMILGSIVGPAIPMLFLLRYFRSGYCVTVDALYCKEGFLFQIEKKILLKDISKTQLVKEKHQPFANFGHLRIEYGEEMKFLVDARNPQELLVAIRKGAKK
jgi:hypothetical protein